MSVAQEATEIERHTAHLSDVDGEPPYTIHGIAIGEGDVTRGSSGIEKKWPREALKPAAETLAGRPLVVDHENDSHAVVGKVTEAFYKEGTGVLYEAELFDEELAEKIANGLLEVSIRGFHGDVSEMDESEEGAKVVQELRFDNLSIVPMGAAPSNTVQIGPSDELSAAECAEIITAVTDREDQLQDELSNGDLVQYEGSNGPTQGRIVEVRTEQDISPDEVVNEKPTVATEDDPAALVEIVSKQDDGKLRETGVKVGKKMSGLIKWEPEELAGDPHEGAEFERHTDEDRYSKDISRYPEGDDTPPEDSEGMHEDDDEETSFENKEADSMEDVEELAVSMHEPEFDEAKDKEWNKPSLSEFLSAMDADAEGWDDLSEEQQSMIADHFLVSRTEEWPPENYGDLALPVVEPDGTLNLNALQNAKARAGQVEGVSSDEESRINEMINSLANENFDATFGDEEENHAIDVVRETQTAFEFADGRIVSVAGDEVEELRSAEKSDEMQAEEQTESTEEEMTSNDDARDTEEAEAEAGEGSEPDANASTSSEQGDSNMTETVEIDKDELENLRAQAEKAEEREEELEELREGFSEDLAELKDRTAVLEDADRELVEELTDADDPIVVESERFEELERHVDEVRDAYADALASHVGMDAETLAEKFSVDELRGQLEEQIDEDAEVEEELTPDPKSEDPESEEELEEASGEAEEEEELAEEAQEKQEELRAKMGLN